MTLILLDRLVVQLEMLSTDADKAAPFIVFSNRFLEVLGRGVTV